jgi:hypothetical protein
LGRAVRRHSDEFNLSEIFFAPQRRGFVLSFEPYGEQFKARRALPSKDFTGAARAEKDESEEGL